jgi:type VI secretion system secreted protein VgrG
MNEHFEAKLSLPGGLMLDLLSVDGTESLSALFSYTVTAFGPAGTKVDFDSLLGKPAEVTVSDGFGPDRLYHGLIANARFEGHVGRGHAWRFELVPWLWLATRSANLRIFQHKSVPDIIAAVVEPYDGVLVKQLSATYAPRDYCVQYRESDFQFVSRLMEDEGIFYFFRHSAGKLEMVLGDSTNVHTTQLSLETMPYNSTPRLRSKGASVTHWSWSSQIRTGKLSLRDHNFQVPAQTYEKSALAQVKHPHGQIEAYDYPGGLAPYGDSPAVVDHNTRHWLEAAQALRASADGATNALRLCVGARFKLTEHEVTAQNGEYIVHGTRTRIRVANTESGVAADSSHDCRFTAFPAALPFRAPRVTPRPCVQGPQTALVVGPAGEEIHVDSYGRVKVQFHWDRSGAKDDHSSCFVRVAQPAAGKGWGVVMLPRIGQEVVVDFLEGDPDQPLVTGGVYNADNLPPYPLPDHKSVSTWKSRSTPKGGTADYNELRMDDTKGSELLFLRAQKDRSDVVQENQGTDIGKDEQRTVGKNRSLAVGESQDTTVGKKFALTVGEDLQIDVGKQLQVSSGEAVGITAGKDFTVDASTAYSMNAGSDVHLKAGANFNAEGGANVNLKAGANVVIEATTQLTLKVGGSSIVIGPDGVSVTGSPLVKINSGGSGGSAKSPKPVKPTKPDKAKKPPPLKDPLDGKHR